MNKTILCFAVLSMFGVKGISQQNINSINFEKAFKVIVLKNADGQMAKGPIGSVLMLDTTNHKVSGKGGCNNFFGKAELHFTESNSGTILISKMGSTMMACPNLQEEQQLFRLLEKANFFAFTDNELLLKRNDEILIRCKQD